MSRTDHQAKRLDDHSGEGGTWSGLCTVPSPGVGEAKAMI